MLTSSIEIRGRPRDHDSVAKIRFKATVNYWRPSGSWFTMSTSLKRENGEENELGSCVTNHMWRGFVCDEITLDGTMCRIHFTNAWRTTSSVTLIGGAELPK